MIDRRLTYLFTKEENRDSHKLHVFLAVQAIPEAEEAIGYALTTMTKTEKLEGWVTDAETPVWGTGEAERNIF